MVSRVGMRRTCKSDAAVTPDNASNRLWFVALSTDRFWGGLYLRRMTGIGAKRSFGWAVVSPWCLRGQHQTDQQSRITPQSAARRKPDPLIEDQEKSVAAPKRVPLASQRPLNALSRRTC